MIFSAQLYPNCPFRKLNILHVLISWGRDKGEGVKGKTLAPFIGDVGLPFSLPSSPFPRWGVI